MATLAKAYFVNRLTGTAFAVQFNPSEMQVKKSVPWSAAEKGAKDPPAGHIDTNIPKQDFKKGDPVTLSLKLEYDTSGLPGPAGMPATDVRDLGSFAELMKLTWAETKNGRTQPPLVDFGWGAGWSSKIGSHDFGGFTGVVKSLSFSYTRFNPDGIPTRASVQVELVEVNPGHPDYRDHGGGGPASKQTFESEVDRTARMEAGR